jgi:murein DD-endopeptidase MepM/ murein hydrolase activator NlpD
VPRAEHAGAMFPPRLPYLFRLIFASMWASTSALCLPPASAIAARGEWLWPLSGEHTVIRDYDVPATTYSAGHRGIDLPAEVDTPVLAPTDAVVSFAGSVAGRGIVTLRIGDVQISLEAVTALVTEGELVTKGQVVANVSTGSHCTCLHVGVRRSGEYLSPLSYFSAIPAAVLQPWDDHIWERAGRI